MSAVMTTEQLKYELEYFFSLADRRHVELTAEKAKNVVLTEKVEHLQAVNELLLSDLQNHSTLSATLSKKLSEVTENQSAIVARSVDMDQRLKRALDVHVELLSENVVLRQQVASFGTLAEKLDSWSGNLICDIRRYRELVKELVLQNPQQT